MASTLTFTAKTVMGDMRVWMGTMTATDGTDEVATGLKYLYGGVATPSVVPGVVPWQSNLVLNSTTNGTIKLTTGISAGVYNVLFIGK